jgi:type VI secretion system protein ImpA
MPDFDLEALSSPLADDASCGANLEYDPAFLALQDAATPKAEQQYGDTLIAAREPDWPAVHDKALQLAGRTRDLRLAVWLVRSGARVAGYAGALQGLQLVRALLERHWAHLHPQLDAEDGNDPTARLNALMPLLHPSAGLADLRAARLTPGRASVSVRDIELALGRVESLPGEAVPSEEGVITGVAAALAETPALRTQMQAGFEAVQGIVAAIEQGLGGKSSPDFTPLLKLMQRVAEAARRVPAAANDPAAATAAPAALPVLAAAGVIASREDAVRSLQRVCDWLEANEPSNPAPLLIHRAQRLMSKSFIDIVRDLAPDGLGQVEKLAGIGKE